MLLAGCSKKCTLVPQIIVKGVPMRDTIVYKHRIPPSLSRAPSDVILIQDIIHAPHKMCRAILQPKSCPDVFKEAVGARESCHWNGFLRDRDLQESRLEITSPKVSALT
jgi:hypothetical protein